MENKLKDLVRVENPRLLLTKNDVIVIGALFGLIFGFLLYMFFGPNYYPGNSPKKLEIKKGETFGQIVDSLYSKGIIANKMALKFAASFYDVEGKIKAGYYSIPNGLSYLDLLDLLVKGAPMKQKLVTIPEGIWQFDLAGLLQKQLGLDSAKIMRLSYNKKFLRSLNIHVKSIEGYLLPNTYYFFTNITEREILKKLKWEMDKIFESPLVRKQMKKLHRTKNEILTLASIIEAESNKESEYPIIAGVYYNRLKRRMKLQADPTIQYLKRKKKHNRIYFKDLEIDSPYNTYKYYGLPPTPINNPGRAAVLAALFPQKNNYLYFVADGKGGHVFSRTLAQHLRKVRKYRQWRFKKYHL